MNDDQYIDPVDWANNKNRQSSGNSMGSRPNESVPIGPENSLTLQPAQAPPSNSNLYPQNEPIHNAIAVEGQDSIMSPLKAMMAIGGISLVLIAVRFVVGIGVGIVLLGGPAFTPILLYVLIIFFAGYALSKMLLPLHRNERAVFSGVASFLVAMNLTTVLVDFDYEKLISGEANQFVSIPVQAASAFVLWTALVLVFKAIQARQKSMGKVVAYVVPILVLVAGIGLYNRSTAAGSFNELIEKDHASQYADLHFDPIYPGQEVAGYQMQERVYINNHANGITDLTINYEKFVDEKRVHFSIQQYELPAVHTASPPCTDYTGLQGYFYSATLQYDCVKLQVGRQDVEVYFLKRDPNKKYERARYLDTAFVTITNYLLIIRRDENNADNLGAEELFAEVVENIRSVEKAVFFGSADPRNASHNGVYATTRDADYSEAN